MAAATEQPAAEKPEKPDVTETAEAQEEVEEKKDDTVDQDVSTKGVNLAWLIDYASKISSEWTTTDVCVNLVMPQTKDKSLAWIELDPDLKFEGLPVVGEADYFVSHAWRYKFRNCVDALRMFAEGKNLDPKETYIWFDLFINNQHDAPNLPHEWWCTRFKEAIRSFGKTVLVLEPWTDPIPITRAWCLWEIYCTVDTDAEFNVTMCEAQHEDFQTKLVKQFEDVRTSISGIDARRADAWNKHDRDMIFKAIEKTVGFSRLNEAVMGKMREWLQKTGQERVAYLKQEKGEDNLETLECINCLGMLFRDQNRMEDAAKLFKTAVDGFSKVTGEASAHTCTALNNLAFCYQSLGKLDESLKMHKRTLAARTKLFGTFHKETSQTMSNMATALRLLGKLEESKKLFKKAVDTRDNIEKLGPNHPATLYTVTQYASCLTLNKDFDEAEKQHKRAVNGLHKFFGKFMPDGRKHPLTLLAIHNLGEHLHAVNKNAEAMDVLLEAYQGRIEKLGAAHENTNKTRTLMETVTDALKDAGQRVRISKFNPESVEAFRKARMERRRLWQKAAAWLAFNAALRQSSQYSDIAADLDATELQGT